MRTLLSTTVALSLLCSGTLCARTIPPEVATPVDLSNGDINRIVCPGTMSDLIFSQEKGLTGHFSGNNAFIKFKIEDAGGDYLYAEEESELFVVCDGAVYTLIATPKDIPSVTLRLAAPGGDSYRENVSRYKKLPLERQALQLIREGMNDSYPESYRVEETAQPVSFSVNGCRATLVQTADVEGTGLQLRKYMLTGKKEGEATLEEKDFLRSDFSTGIVAVALEDHTLKAEETTRLFLVTRKGVEKQKDFFQQERGIEPTTDTPAATPATHRKEHS